MSNETTEPSTAAPAVGNAPNDETQESSAGNDTAMTETPMTTTEVADTAKQASESDKQGLEKSVEKDEPVHTESPVKEPPTQSDSDASNVNTLYPQPNDVLLGLKAENRFDDMAWPGNAYFRKLLHRRKDTYRRKDREKAEIAKEIIHYVREKLSPAEKENTDAQQTSGGGRFFKAKIDAPKSPSDWQLIEDNEQLVAEVIAALEDVSFKRTLPSPAPTTYLHALYTAQEYSQTHPRDGEEKNLVPIFVIHTLSPKSRAAQRKLKQMDKKKQKAEETTAPPKQLQENRPPPNPSRKAKPAAVAVPNYPFMMPRQMSGARPVPVHGYPHMMPYPTQLRPPYMSYHKAPHQPPAYNQQMKRPHPSIPVHKDPTPPKKVKPTTKIAPRPPNDDKQPASPVHGPEIPKGVTVRPSGKWVRTVQLVL